MDDHYHKHYKGKGQVSHMPVSEKVLHGYQPVDSPVKGDFVFDKVQYILPFRSG
jgi:hypothetical protein